jgi:hypothetical protein
MNTSNQKVKSPDGIYYVRLLTEKQMYARCLLATIIMFVLLLMVFMEIVLVLSSLAVEEYADFWSSTIRIGLFMSTVMLIHTDTM